MRRPVPLWRPTVRGTGLRVTATKPRKIMFNIIKEEIKDFATYQWPKYNTQIKYMYVFSVYFVGVFLAHEKLEIPYIWLLSIALATLLFPIYWHIKRTIKRRSKEVVNIRWKNRDTKTINALSDTMQDKVYRHQISAILFLELMTLQENVNDPNKVRDDEKAKLMLEILRLRLDVIEYFAREKNKYSDMSIKDMDIPSL